jgi:hypothetical protein
VTRRNLIRQALLLLGIDSAGLMGCVAGRAAENICRPSGAVVQPATPGGMLSGAEVENLVAFGEVLVEGRPLELEERGYLAEHLEYRARGSPEYLALYRRTAVILERLAGRRFADLEIRERIALIDRHRLVPSRGWPGESLDLLNAETRADVTRTVKDLISGYYASEAGWAIVGQDAFPGRCGDLTRYTRPEA